MVCATEAKFFKKSSAALSKQRRQKAKLVKNDFVYPEETHGNCGDFNITAADKKLLAKNAQLEKNYFPWIVYLMRKMGKKHEPVCLASLLPDVDEYSTSILLTDSTCIRDKNNLDDYFIYTGNEFPVKDTNQLHAIVSVVIDKNTPNPMEHNAMVITIEDEIVLDEDRKVVCLPNPKDVPHTSAVCVLTAVRPDEHRQPKPVLYDVMYTSMKDCKEYSPDANDADSRIHVCGFDQRQGSMLSKGGTMLCEEKGKWTQYGVVSYGRHVIEKYDPHYVDKDIRDMEKPSIIVSVARFRALMSDSKSLMKFGRINLMRMRR